MQQRHCSKWRQGSLVKRELAIELGLFDYEEDRFAVVITHDCDIASTKEPYVEIMVASRVKSVSSMYENAKHPRVLHLKYSANDEDYLYLEMRSQDKKFLAREEFLERALPEEMFVLDNADKRILKQWLAGRFGRPAYPDSFENRLSNGMKKQDFEKKIVEILQESQKHILGVYFDLGESREEELPEGEPYILNIVLVYSTQHDAVDAMLKVDAAALSLMRFFHEVHGGPDVSQTIALEVCEAVPDTGFAVSDLRKVDQWRVEYVSLNPADPSEFLSISD